MDSTTPPGHGSTHIGEQSEFSGYNDSRLLNPAANTTMLNGMTLRRLEITDVHYLADGELDFEIRLRGGTPKRTIPMRKRQLRLLIERENKGLIKPLVSTEDVSHVEVEIMGSVLEEFSQKVRLFTDCRGSPEYRRLYVRMQHWMNRAREWRVFHSEALRGQRQAVLLRWSNLLRQLDISALEWEEDSQRVEMVNEQNVGRVDNLNDPFEVQENVPADMITFEGAESSRRQATIPDMRPRPSISFDPRPRSSSLIPPVHPAHPSDVANVRQSVFSIPEPRVYSPLSNIKAHQWGLRFTGESDSISAYCFLEKLDLKLRVHRISRDDILPHLSELLEGEAFTWYLSRIDQFPTWDTFESAFMCAFGDNRSRAHLLQQVANTKQEPSESVTSYMSRLRLILRRSPEKLSECTQVDLAISGALPKYQEFLISSAAMSLNDIETRLRQLEVKNEHIGASDYVFKPSASTFENKKNFQKSRFEPRTKERFESHTKDTSRGNRYFQKQPPFAPSQPNYHGSYPMPPTPFSYPVPPCHDVRSMNASMPFPVSPPVGHALGNANAPFNARSASHRRCYACGLEGYTLKTCPCQRNKSGNDTRRS